MEFIKALIEDDGSIKYNEKMKELGIYTGDDETYRGFNHVKKDGVSLSIQASYGHYCTPRLTLSNLDDYSSMEFALIRNGEFIQVKEILPKLSVVNEIEEYFDGSVYGFVPVNLIEELYKAFVA